MSPEEAPYRTDTIGDDWYVGGPAYAFGSGHSLHCRDQHEAENLARQMNRAFAAGKRQMKLEFQWFMQP